MTAPTASPRKAAATITVTHAVSGVSFLTQPGKFTQLISDTVSRITGQSPVFSTSGGTSDARFIKDHCPVVELGLAGATMHKTDECVPVQRDRNAHRYLCRAADRLFRQAASSKRAR